MGQAFDESGNVLGEAYGETRREVFEKLISEFKHAHEYRIKSIKPDGTVEREADQLTNDRGDSDV